mmetsp:Transcript_98742/g.170087  ORF Transcript_98742/g.170087 Transcript_98742/m.170087 type:complete len:232 (+) Transcript_98742:223-918(+)
MWGLRAPMLATGTGAARVAKACSRGVMGMCTQGNGRRMLCTATGHTNAKVDARTWGHGKMASLKGMARCCWWVVASMREISRRGHVKAKAQWSTPQVSVTRGNGEPTKSQVGELAAMRMGLSTKGGGMRTGRSRGSSVQPTWRPTVSDSVPQGSARRRRRWRLKTYRWKPRRPCHPNWEARGTPPGVGVPHSPLGSFAPPQPWPNPWLCTPRPACGGAKGSSFCPICSATP